MSKKRILFIINPIAGQGKSLDWGYLIKENLDHHLFSFQIQLTAARGEATQMALDAVSQEIEIVCAVGGDGTIREVALGLIGSESTLAIIPRGSGNGLSRHLGIPLATAMAIKRLNQASIHTMDTGLINGQRFLCVAGMGYDALIAHAFDQFGNRGWLSYAWLSFKHYFTYRPANFEMVIDGAPLKTRAFLITFANASQFGNNARIAPNASTEDGKLDLVILLPFPIQQIPVLVIRLFRGTLPQSHYCLTRSFTRLEIQVEDSLAHLDGEPFSTHSPMTVNIDPNSLKILY